MPADAFSRPIQPAVPVADRMRAIVGVSADYADVGRGAGRLIPALVGAAPGLGNSTVGLLWRGLSVRREPSAGKMCHVYHLHLIWGGLWLNVVKGQRP